MSKLEHKKAGNNFGKKSEKDWKHSPDFVRMIKVFIKGTFLFILLAILGLFFFFHLETIAPNKRKRMAKQLVKENNLLQLRKQEAENPIQNGIHQPTGLIADEGLEIVVATCTACHSAKLLTQNRASRDGWIEMIVWMQETQGLWDLGANEAIIVDYLAKNYTPTNTGRRKPLENIEWYELNPKPN